MNKIATTWQVFKANTGYDGKADKRGSQIRKIDDAFKQYDLNFGGGTQTRQIALTMALYTECKDWLKKKQQKSDFKTGFLKVTTLNQNLADASRCNRNGCQGMRNRASGGCSNLRGEKDL